MIQKTFPGRRTATWLDQPLVRIFTCVAGVRDNVAVKFDYHDMKRPIFRSITALVIAGFVAAALPLVIAVTNGALQVRDLGMQAERNVVQSVQMTRQSGALSSELVSMERNARQYQVLGDEDIKEIYLQRHDDVMDAIKNLAESHSVFAASGRLDTIKQELRNLRVIMTSDDNEEALQVALPAFREIHSAADSVVQTARNAMSANLAALSQQAERTQTTMIRQTVILGLLGLILAALFVRAILKPIRQINETITRLGEDRYDEEVDIGGPRDLQHIGERLEWLARRLSELEGLKNEFMRHMSHELKTPLANIRESTALLKDETVSPLSKGQSEIVDILDKSSVRLTLLINNLLEFSQWKEQHSSLSVSTFSVPALVAEVMDEHHLAIENRGLNVDVNVDEPLMISADRDRIRTLVTNLMSNAIKYSPPGGRVTLKAGQKDNCLEVDVIDEGPGIPEEERLLVFKPFFQSTDSRLVSTEGTGIGLSLVQECVHAHGGQGEFLETDKGSHFHASLPVVVEETT